MDYKPGLHILLTTRDVSAIKLTDLKSWNSLIKKLISHYGLHCLGTVEHTFSESGGYTAVHCLTESHISIHTWPEHNLCTCDIFLSNFNKDNRETVKQIAKSILDFFESSNFDLKEIER